MKPSDLSSEITDGNLAHDWPVVLRVENAPSCPARLWSGALLYCLVLQLVLAAWTLSTMMANGLRGSQNQGVILVQLGKLLQKSRG